MSTNIDPGYTYEGIEVVPADMDAVREIVSLYETTSPPPKPPMARIQTFESVSAGLEYDEIEDTTDETYVAAMDDHRRQVYRIMELYFIRHCVNNPDALSGIMDDDVKRTGLFRYIVDISEVTQEAVAKAMDNFRVHVAKTTPVSLQDAGRSCRDADRGACLLCCSKVLPNGTVGFRQAVGP